LCAACWSSEEVDSRERGRPRERKDFPSHVREKEKRKLKAREEGRENLWMGLGLFGVVGWSVAVPTLLGAFLGLWIDLSRPGRYSWTLMFVILGLGLGCANAWYWVNKQRRAILRKRESHGN